jgi:hypothetical protein
VVCLAATMAAKTADLFACLASVTSMSDRLMLK